MLGQKDDIYSHSARILSELGPVVRNTWGILTNAIPLVKIIALFPISIKLSSAHQNREFSTARWHAGIRRVSAQPIKVPVKDARLTLAAKKDQCICHWLEERCNDCLLNNLVFRCSQHSRMACSTYLE
jgi:hypothetical protein